jgi:Na+/H+ antiporter NhaD/arsenite permease-like protein
MHAIHAPLALLADGALGQQLPVWSIAPFALILLSIALLPLVAHHWWESNRNRAIVSFGLAIPFVLWLWSSFPAAAPGALGHAAMEYVSFLSLLGALYIISGGIYLKGSLNGTPLSNTGMLAIGAVLANLIGTTGASMVLIRPFLRANKSRQRRAHQVVFFIFIVSNCGGLLTPFADPPLYLGFLKGVPFEWTLQLWKEWLLVNAALLVMFNFLDGYMIDKEEKERPGSQLEEAMKHEPLGIEGKHNIVLLAGVVFAILGSAQGWFNGGAPWSFGVAEACMASLAVLGLAMTKPAIRAANAFTYGPILEVAILFGGIFATMIAPMQILNARGAELGIAHPAQYFWATGILSSFLDNAPTYLTFAAVACGQAGIALDGQYLAKFLELGGENITTLMAISCGAVMMGANTYIGNGPNFMVKAIAEENGVKMPSFFGYMAWSLAVLVPLFAVVTWVFFL